MTELLMVVPVRGRRALAARFIESFAATRELDTRLLLVADTGDDSYDGMSLPSFCTMRVIPREYVSVKVNRFAVPAANHYAYVGNTGDDNIMETPGWDRLLIEPHEKKGLGWSYPDDIRRQDIPENVVIASPIIKALGWFQCPMMRMYYVDHVWADLANATGRLHYVPAVVQPHKHHLTDPDQPRDATYRDGEVHGAHDGEAYETWKRTRFAEDLEIVRGALCLRGEPPDTPPRRPWEPQAARS
jgi:hypothetical protein